MTLCEIFFRFCYYGDWTPIRHHSVLPIIGLKTGWQLPSILAFSFIAYNFVLIWFADHSHRLLVLIPGSCASGSFVAVLEDHRYVKNQTWVSLMQRKCPICCLCTRTSYSGVINMEMLGWSATFFLTSYSIGQISSPWKFLLRCSLLPHASLLGKAISLTPFSLGAVFVHWYGSFIFMLSM